MALLSHCGALASRSRVHPPLRGAGRHRCRRCGPLPLARPERRTRTLPLHITPRRAGEIAAGAGVRMLVLTHLPPTADPALAVELAQARFPGTIALATEGATFEVGS